MVMILQACAAFINRSMIEITRVTHLYKRVVDRGYTCIQ